MIGGAAGTGGAVGGGIVGGAAAAEEAAAADMSSSRICWGYVVVVVDLLGRNVVVDAPNFFTGATLTKNVVVDLLWLCGIWPVDLLRVNG